MKLSSLKTRLTGVNATIFIIAAIIMVFFVNYFEKQNAFKNAEAKSTILLKHNLAIHSYINTKLKPTLFALTDTIRKPEYFEPTWMSSTYAVRDIDKLYRQNSESGYYYKEAAINSRSPENEADDFERDFIQKLNKDKNVDKISGVRDFDGKPYFFTLIRGESMEKGCMRCHSTPDKAPANLVKTYGDTRSFNRSIDEAVSAISIRMPLELAYHEANVLSAKLSGMLIILLLVSFSLQIRFINQLVLTPLKRFKTETESITNNPEKLGSILPQFDNKEMDEIAISFNNMSGKLKGFVDSLDETIRERTANLLESEAKYRMLVNNLSSGVVVHTSDSSIIFANPMASTLLGLSKDQMMGKTAIDPDWCFVRENGTPMPLEEYPVNRVLNYGKPLANYVLGVCRPDLTNPLWVLCNAYPIESPEGLLQQVVVVFSDITLFKNAEAEKLFFEQQIQQTQKLESLGVLSGGIAHDFNNILAIIMGYCSLTKMDYEDAEKHIPEIEKAAERAAGLCRQMLAYAGKAQLVKTHINMWMLVDEMVTMLKSTLPQNAVIKPELATDIPFIDADASQLRQVVMNLIINASEAIGDGHGEIQVSLATTSINTGQSEQDYNGNKIPLGDYLCLEVTDNGCGMDEATKCRVFEPFYTTKFTGRGLGMSAVLGIINSHGGSLQLQSHLGQGTTFKVYLPVPKTHSTEIDDQKHIPSALWKGSGTILLVEDEDQVRLIAKALLKNIGFTVLEAVNGKEALELYQSNATDITLVITDMGMPVMDGYELFYELKKLNPELPIIVSSGYGDAEVSSRIDIDNIAGLISKPYGPDQLCEVLKSVVEYTEQ